MSKWSALVLFVPKKNEKLCFCVDYRKLNIISSKDTYRLRNMNECTIAFDDAQCFTSLEAYPRYWQIKIRKNDRPTTTFVWNDVTFHCTRIPVLSNDSLACFQWALNHIFTKYKWKTCPIYLDDVIMISFNVGDHINHVEGILTTSLDACVALKISKGNLPTTSRIFLTHGQTQVPRSRQNKCCVTLLVRKAAQWRKSMRFYVWVQCSKLFLMTTTTTF